MAGPKFLAVREWMAALAKTFAGKAFLLLGGVGILELIFPTLDRQFIRYTLRIVTFVSFAWANFAVYEVQRQAAKRAEEQLRQSRISIQYTNGWYAVARPNTAYTQVSLHIRLELNFANRDERNTTFRFKGITVPGQTHLVLQTASLQAAQDAPSPGTPAARTIDVYSGQTVPAILELMVSVPNTDLSVWGRTVSIEVQFEETYGKDLAPLLLTVPHAPQS